ncbi:hypothetical protein CEXT_637071 [Caerostris extrusa]|uniref:Uncharacterized protein n=1 Tax=Caerostris extrusa TaxID=172846 RepID=A0AAV4T9F8_CAEEX|nr:hypothetical protein CEXT_637071 [Caerostris extrusa]
MCIRQSLLNEIETVIAEIHPKNIFAGRFAQAAALSEVRLKNIQKGKTISTENGMPCTVSVAIHLEFYSIRVDFERRESQRPSASWEKTVLKKRKHPRVSRVGGGRLQIAPGGVDEIERILTSLRKVAVKVTGTRTRHEVR